MKRILLKIFLLSTVSLLFLSCSNIFSSDSSSENSQKETTSLEAHKYVTITGTISLPEELTESGALPEDYLFIHNVTNTIQNRSAFPATPTSTDYYVTATSTGETTINVNPTETESGATFSITLPVRDTEKSWSIEAGLKASFNGSTAVILKDVCSVTISSTSPTFNHNFVIKPLETGNGNVELTMSFQSSNAADELELYFDNTKITAGTGEEISPTKISLKNRAAGAYKAKLVFKKNGYVVFSDYEGINIFPNMTTNTWHHNGGDGSSEPIQLISGTWRYYVTNASIASYMLTQIYVGNTNIGGTTTTASDTTGSGTVFAPFATFAKAIDYLQKNGDTGKDYTIWISGEITGAQTISDGTEEAPTPVKASSLTISGVTGNTSDSLKGGSSGSVLTVDTAVPVTITNLKITGGSANTGGGINITKGTVTLSTGALIADNSASTSGGAIYVDANGTLKIEGSAKVTKINDTSISEKHNDIYLTDSKTLEIVGALDSTATATITVSSLVRGTQVLSGSCTSANIEKIHVSDSEWNIISHSNVGKLDAPLYVSSATGASDSNTGTALHPYVTVKQAAMQVWNTANDNETTINIVGEVTGVAGGATGAQQYIEVSASVTNPKIRLKGTTNTAKINPNPNNGTENRKALGINSKVDLTIEQLTITGGNTTGHGAGIYSNIAGVTLTLDTGAIVSGNTVNNTSGYAGGIYITGSNSDRAKLIMKTGSQIKGNYAVNGGGVYLSYADLCMSGTALIGESATSPATNTTGGNKATKGGGVYTTSSGIIWLGYSAPNDNENSVLALTDGYGICHNYASNCGGGIYNDGGIVKMKTGAISYNGNNTSGDTGYGGGIYNLKGIINLSGGQINRNLARNGGGIYTEGENGVLDAKIFLTGSALIGGSGTGAASEITGNYALPPVGTPYGGGGIYSKDSHIFLGYASCDSSGNPTGKTELTGGICQNFASYKVNDSSPNTAYAGGISMHNSKLYFDSGNINYNGAGSAGGINIDWDWCILAMTGGTISGNSATNTTDGHGGAIFIKAGTIMGTDYRSQMYLSGTTSAIPSTGVRENDIYFSGNPTIIVNGSLSNSFATKITSSACSIGKQVLQPESDTESDIAYITNNFTKFSLTNENYYIISNGNMFSAPSVQSVTAFVSGNTYAACSQADLSYLEGKVNTSNNRQSCSGATIKLANNITITGNYEPIGNWHEYTFEGTFDGNNKTITYNNVTAFSYHVGGIIGYASNATIKNLNVAGSFNSTAEETGGIIGYIRSSEGTITNCNSSVNITSTGTQVGGIIGYADSSGERDIIIDGCENSGNVTNTRVDSYGCGGIVGDASACIIRNCINTGTVTSTRYAGGIVGDHAGSPTNGTDHGCEIRNCGNMGNIIVNGSGSDLYAGGITGGQNALNENWLPTIEYCFSSGTVTSTSTNARGIVGYSSSGTTDWNGSITKVYYLSGSAANGGVYFGEEKASTYTSASAILTQLNGLNTSLPSIYKKWKVSGNGFVFDE